MKRLLLLVLLVAVASGAAAPSAQRGGVVPSGVAVGGLRVGDLPVEKARAAIAWSYNRPLRFVFYGTHWRISPSELGATVDVNRTLERALQARPGQQVAVYASVDRDRVAAYSQVLARRLSVDPVNASATLTSKLTPVLHPGKPGLQIRLPQTEQRIETALNLARRAPVRPAAKTVAPLISRNHFGPVVVVHRGTNTMNVYSGVRAWRTLKVATGQSIYPTPVGNWHVVDMQRNPWWIPPDSPWAEGLKPIPPGPGNPLGTRWMGLNAPGVGMHGTPDAASIGYSASHGCIRMYVPDAEWLFDRVHIGTPVFIVS